MFDNVFIFMLQIFDKLKELGDWAYNFITYEFGIGRLSVSFWMLLGGVGLTSIIIYRLIK